MAKPPSPPLERQPKPTTLREFFELGKIVKALGPRFPHGVANQYATAYGLDEDNVRKARTFAELYDKAGVDRLQQHGFTWSHVRAILGVRSETRRRDLETKLVAEKLTVRQLETAVHAGRPRVRRGAGRKNDIPRVLNCAMDRLALKLRALDSFVSEFQSAHERNRSAKAAQADVVVNLAKLEARLQGLREWLNNSQHAVAEVAKKVRKPRRREPADRNFIL